MIINDDVWMLGRHDEMRRHDVRSLLSHTTQAFTNDIELFSTVHCFSQHSSRILKLCGDDLQLSSKRRC